MLQDSIIGSTDSGGRQLRYMRSKFRRISSLDLIPEDPSQEDNSSADDDHQHLLKGKHSRAMNKFKGLTRRSQSAPQLPLTKVKRFNGLLMFWPNLLMQIVMLMLRFLLCIPLSVAAPSFWLSALLWIFWKLIRIPIGFVRSIQSITGSWLNETNDDQNEGDYVMFDGQRRRIREPSPANRRTTVLLSCGSTIQTLHLARNFYSSGARVITFEFDGLFGLCRFSTAVDKFYVVPRPTPHNIDNYIAALCHIVRKEKPTVYIPVCATSPAYYDAVAKPHLELLGCASFITGVQDTIVLDDCLQFYRRCAKQNIKLAPYMCISSLSQLWNLYNDGFIQQFRNILVAVGMQGILERFKYVLPRQRTDLKFCHEINDQQQWLVIRDVPGDHYVTCTTIKNSQVVANTSCRIDHQTNNLIPLTKDVNGPPSSTALSIEHWLKVFFAKVRFQRQINCHLSFRLIKCQSTGDILPLGIRIGVSLPYICYNQSHTQVLCRRASKCIHLKPLQLMGASARNDESNNYAASDLLTDDGQQPQHNDEQRDVDSDEAFSSDNNHPNNIIPPLDKREALFTYWDPLPYCAYYHFQLPLESVKAFLQKKRRKTYNKNLTPRLTMPVH